MSKNNYTSDRTFVIEHDNKKKEFSTLKMLLMTAQ